MTVFVCPPAPQEGLPLNTVLAVGFGIVTVTRDGKRIWSGDDEGVWLRRFERRAQREGGTWCVEFHGPLSGSTYERRGKGDWQLIARNGGFA